MMKHTPPIDDLLSPLPYSQRNREGAPRIRQFSKFSCVSFPHPDVE